MGQTAAWKLCTRDRPRRELIRLYNMQTVNFTKYFQIVSQGDILTLTFHQLPIMTSSYYSTSLSVLDTAKLLNFHQSKGIKYHLNLSISNGVGLLSNYLPSLFLHQRCVFLYLLLIFQMGWHFYYYSFILDTKSLSFGIANILLNYWLVFSLFKNYLSPNRIPSF